MNAAIPETTADARKMIGIKAVDYHGLALTAPNRNPTYPCSTQAAGIPAIASTRINQSSTASDSFEISRLPKDSIRYSMPAQPLMVCAIATMSGRNTSQT